MADEATLRAGGYASDGAALLDYFRRRTLSNEDQERLKRTIRRLGDNAFGNRERASRELIEAGRASLTYLRAALDDPDLEIRSRAERCIQEIEGSSATALALAAARLLAVRKPDGASEVILQYLPFVDDEVVEEELLASLGVVALRDGKADAAVVEGLGDKHASRRAAAALVVGKSPDADQRDPVRRLLADADAKVRFRAAQGLLAACEKDAFPTLIGLIGEGPRPLAWQAEEILCRIAGEQAPPSSVGAGGEPERRKARDAWAGWWGEHGPTLDLAKAELEQRSLGLTLIVAFDGYGGQGKLWETRADGKPRWELTMLQGAIDAQVLPGNRVLVAEHNGRRVTERDLQGKVIWEFAVPNNQYPVACQRLSNGNTFIATYNQVLEVTPDRKQLYSYPCRNGIIYSAQKLRNGNVVYVTSGGVLVEHDDKGKEVKSLRIGPVNGWVTVEALPGGRYLVPQAANSKVVELDAEGKVVTTYNVTGANAASKLPNGNLLICRHNERTVVEVDREGKVIWEQRLEGRPFWSRRR